MKFPLKQMTVLAAVLVAALLSGCGGGGGGGGGGSQNPPPSALMLTASQSGGYVDQAEWHGSITVINAATNQTGYQPMYFELLRALGFCNSGPFQFQGTSQCSLASGYFGLEVSTVQTTDGGIPGPVAFRLRPYFNSKPREWFSAEADGYVNAANLGILIKYNTLSNLQQTSPFPGAVNNGVGAGNNSSTILQIATQFTDRSESAMIVDVYYQGVRIGTGRLKLKHNNEDNSTDDSTKQRKGS